MKKLPQIDEKGLSQDYKNEIAKIYTDLQIYEKTGDDRLLKKHRMKMYDNRFPEDEYSDVITEKNKHLVSIINSAAEKINELLDDNVRDMDEYYRLIDKIDLCYKP